MADLEKSYSDELDTVSVSDCDDFDPPSDDEWDDDICFEKIVFELDISRRAEQPSSVLSKRDRDNLEKQIRVKLPTELQLMVLEYTLIGSIRLENGGREEITVRHTAASDWTRYQAHYNDPRIQRGLMPEIPPPLHPASDLEEYHPPWQLQINHDSRRSVATWYYGQHIFRVLSQLLVQPEIWLGNLPPHHLAMLKEVRVNSRYHFASRADIYGLRQMFEQSIQSLQDIRTDLAKKDVKIGKEVLKIEFFDIMSTAANTCSDWAAPYKMVWCNEDEAHELRRKTVEAGYM